MREISASELREHGLFVASPQFGGQCSTIFARSIADLAIVSGNWRFPLEPCFYMNESLIMRGRNNCVDAFLKQSKAQHLLFIDADIGFTAQDAMELLILQIQNPEYEIIGAPYKRKALNAGYAFDYKQDIDFGAKEPVEVWGIGTGFMLIRRDVFSRFSVKFPQYRYLSDDQPGDYESGKEVGMYFHAEIDP